ncbi:hypothetical protein A2U01_0017578, partial [Trifolium medium]|nr:hypothetical protein [Trifolium medium]
MVRQQFSTASDPTTPPPPPPQLGRLFTLTGDASAGYAVVGDTAVKGSENKADDAAVGNTVETQSQ